MTTQKSLFTSLLSGTFLLLCAPIFVFISGWQWQPFTEIPLYLYPLFLISETGTVPQVLITCLIFAGIALLYLKLSLKKAVLCSIIICTYLGAGQVVKGTMKNIFQEGRPYVTWLQAENLINTDDFYQLTRAQRAEFIRAQDFSSYNLPDWQQKHWSKETGYSFPSGHTIFAAQWLLLYLLLLGRKKAYLPITFISVWAVSMEISRMILGMHWASDVFVSSLLAAALIYPTYLYCCKWDIIAR